LENKKITRYFYSILILWWFTIPCVMAQKTVVRGTVTDAQTAQPMPFVTLILDSSEVGTTTDMQGHYVLETQKKFSQLRAFSIGYKAVTKPIVTGTAQVLNFKLQLKSQTLNEVLVVDKGKSKYKRKGNPAVALIRKVIDHKAGNRKENFSFYEYERYEKIQLAFNNVSEKLRNRHEFKKFQFLFQDPDTADKKGKSLLPIYMKETLSDIKYRKSPEAKKEIVKGVKLMSFERTPENNGIDSYIQYLYQDINIYDNDILFLSNQFVSPISVLAPVFYQYFIVDTLVEDNVKCIKLGFVPGNKNNFLFQGYLFIVMDSSYAVKKVEMTLDESVNMNWIQDLKIIQEFEKQNGLRYVLKSDEFSADFGLKKDQLGVSGKRYLSYKNYQINKARPDVDYDGPKLEVRSLADSLIQKSRHIELTASEKRIYADMDSVKKTAAFKTFYDIAVLSVSAYKDAGPVEFGPLNTFISFNPVEGFKARVGGRTTIAFSKKINFDGYVAYGFKDRQPKYFLASTYSFTDRSIYEFPVKSLRASYQYDTKIPGQDNQLSVDDNFILSFKRGINNKWMYSTTYTLDYLNEFKNHFSYGLGYKNWIQKPLLDLHYNTKAYNEITNNIPQIQTSELNLFVRWAPNEQFYQGKTTRVPIALVNPVFFIRYSAGMKGLLGGDYAYQNITLNISKRFFLSRLGYADVSLEGGKIIGTVPYPLLFIHRANQTYTYQQQSYNLMNFMEFMSDQYTSLHIDHNLNGFLFNQIPLIKKLKWREVVTLKVLYGSLSANNDPDKNASLYKLPIDNAGQAASFIFDGKPYVEGGVGISNIFNFLRLDLVRRFSYTDHPNISTLGLRGRMKFDF
jgi:hypothetical protein